MGWEGTGGTQSELEVTLVSLMCSPVWFDIAKLLSTALKLSGKEFTATRKVRILFLSAFIYVLQKFPKSLFMCYLWTYLRDLFLLLVGHT